MNTMYNIQAFANILGYIGLIIIWIQVVFGNRYVFKYFTTDTVKMNKLHKYLGIYGSVLAFAHPIEEMYAYMSDWLWIWIPSFSSQSETYISIGRMALYIMLMIWISSAILKSKMKWTPWKYIHLTAYPLFVLVWWHAISIGTYARDYILVWTLLYMLMMTFVIVLALRLATWGGLMKNVYRIKDMESVNGEIIILKIAPNSKKIKKPKIGQHVYIQLDMCKSEHPFTVMEQSEEGDLSFGIRNLGSFAEDLNRKFVGQEIYIDGPYGSFTREAQNDDKKVIISGGVGVTPFVDLVRYHGGSNTFYINCNKGIESALKRDVLLQYSGKYVDIKGIISIDDIHNFLAEDMFALGVKYFICGSPAFVEHVRGLLLSVKIDKKLVYVEELGF